MLACNNGHPQHCSNGFISESAPHSRRLKMKVMQTKLIPKLGVWSLGGGGGGEFRFVLHVGVISGVVMIVFMHADELQEMDSPLLGAECGINDR